MKKWRRGKGTRFTISTIPVPALTPRTHVDSQLAEIRVELTRETQASGDTRHDNGDQVVEVTVCGGRELQCPEADIVESLVIDTEGLVRVLDELVNGESRVVRLDDSVGHLG